jgi:hypothetical protein
LGFVDGEFAGTRLDRVDSKLIFGEICKLENDVSVQPSHAK